MLLVRRFALSGRRRLILLVCVLLGTISGAVGYAATQGEQITYEQGVYGANTWYPTDGWSNREYNRVWHQVGYQWSVVYTNPGDGPDSAAAVCRVTNDLNPTTCAADSSYKKSWCKNWFDTSGVTWTCQTTNGFLGQPESPHRPRAAKDAKAAGGVEPASTPGDRARDVLRAFDRTRTSGDVLPALLVAEVLSLNSAQADVPAAVRPGIADASQSRALLLKLGSRAETLYAVPTNVGAVCLALTFQGVVGCVDRFSPAVPFVWDVRDLDSNDSGEPPLVDGLAPGAVAVIIGLKRGSAQAKLRDGAFFYELKDPTDRPKTITILYANRPAQVVRVPSSSRPGDSPDE